MDEKVWSVGHMDECMSFNAGGECDLFPDIKLHAQMIVEIRVQH